MLIRGGKQRTPLPVDERVSVVGGALRDQAALQQLVNDCDVIVHCAASVRGACWQDFYQANVIGTRNLLSAINTSSSARHLVVISSLAAREPQLSWYAESKFLAEQSCRALSGPSCAILRPPAVYGPGDKEMLPLLRMLYRGYAVRVTPAEQRLSLIHVDDLITALVALSEQPTTGLYSLNDGEPNHYDWDKLCHIISEYSGNKVRALPLPPMLLKTIAQVNLRLARIRGEKPILSPGKAQELLWRDWTSDNQVLREATGWAPAVRLAEGLRGLKLGG